MNNNEFDIVKHPRHYNRDNAMECIDEMELIYGPEAVMWFCLLSQHKYRYRAGLKDNGFQDLAKSDWYMNKYKELKKKLDSKSDSITVPYSPIISPTWPPQPTVTYCNNENNLNTVH